MTYKVDAADLAEALRVYWWERGILVVTENLEDGICELRSHDFHPDWRQVGDGFVAGWKWARR